LRARRILVVCLLVALPLLAADSLRTADSLHNIGNPSSGWLDTTLTAADSLGTAAGLTHRWLLPLALTAAMLGGLYLLFSVRSK
jgi:hypothetical protein